MNDLPFLLALSFIPKLGPVSGRSLISYCGGTAESVFATPKGKLLKVPGIGETIAEAILEQETLTKAEEEISRCEKLGIQIIPYDHPTYPRELTYIFDAPLILYQKGNVKLNAQPNIAIVGTRKPTDQGRDITREFAEFFVSHGINVMSGLAYGIDITAHKTAMEMEGMTTAVLGHGLDSIYPATHARHAFAMQERGGLLTEYPLGIKPDPRHFPARNRIVSGICKAVIVIEAAERGGALITAHQAFEQNREVYAVPGRIGDTYSVGCNKLIKNQVAKLITHPQEVLDDLEIQWEPKANQQLDLALEMVLSLEETKIMNYLHKGDAVVDHISHQTGIPMSQLNSLLLSMEFKGLIAQAPGKKFRKK
ncbi:MAG: DNA-processing protein DprA [Bacteroidota bacterium]